MKTRKNLFVIIPLVFLFLLGPSSFGDRTVFARYENKVKPGEFVIEPPTLICLGFEWYIEGDDNHDATVDVGYRKKGDTDWKEALPLLRLYHEETFAGATYVAPNMFAGSIFDLEPDTEYECVFRMSDPDGVSGENEKLITVRTRPEPKPFEGGRIFHVYPPEYTGPKEEPAFANLRSAYYEGRRAMGGDWSNVFPPRVQPGDTILVHAGLYVVNRDVYPGHNPFDGTNYLTQNGTPEKPIAIKAAGDGEVIFDGEGNYNLFNVMAANYNYFEGLTIRNTDVAFLAGHKRITGSSGLTVKNCRFENIGIAVFTDWSGSKNFYIADNVMIGRQDPDYLTGYTGEPWVNLPGYPPPIYSYYGVKIYGSGHVICHNYVAHFHDGLTHATYGMPDGYPDVPRDRMPVSIDFYNNDISNVQDNCIETDGAMHNARVLRNRCLNIGLEPLSGQPILGGPAYFIRNIAYHAPGIERGVVKTAGRPQGLFFYHNTLGVEAGARGGFSNIHFRNNLILGEGAFPEIFQVDTFTNYTTSDYNGFYPNEGVEYSFIWASPPFEILADYVSPRVVRKFKTLPEYSEATGQDENSILIGWDIFYDLAKPDLNDPQRVYIAEDLNFELKTDAVAVDAGVILPNINDDFTGSAPDLGALEVGKPMPIYGPRQ